MEAENPESVISQQEAMQAQQEAADRPQPCQLQQPPEEDDAETEDDPMDFDNGDGDDDSAPEGEGDGDPDDGQDDQSSIDDPQADAKSQAQSSPSPPSSSSSSTSGDASQQTSKKRQRASPQQKTPKPPADPHPQLATWETQLRQLLPEDGSGLPLLDCLDHLETRPLVAEFLQSCPPSTWVDLENFPSDHYALVGALSQDSPAPLAILAQQIAARVAEEATRPQPAEEDGRATSAVAPQFAFTDEQVAALEQLLARAIPVAAKRRSYGLTKVPDLEANEDSDLRARWIWEAEALTHVPKALHRDLKNNRRHRAAIAAHLKAVAKMIQILSSRSPAEAKIQAQAEKIEGLKDKLVKLEEKLGQDAEKARMLEEIQQQKAEQVRRKQEEKQQAAEQRKAELRAAKEEKLKAAEGKLREKKAAEEKKKAAQRGQQAIMMNFFQIAGTPSKPQGTGASPSSAVCSAHVSVVSSFASSGGGGSGGGVAAATFSDSADVEDDATTVPKISPAPVSAATTAAGIEPAARSRRGALLRTAVPGFLDFEPIPHMRLAPVHPSERPPAEAAELALFVVLAPGAAARFVGTQPALSDSEIASELRNRAARWRLQGGRTAAAPPAAVAKLLQFHTDYRPAWHGRGHVRAVASRVVTGRKPFGLDPLCDYSVDSDDEWGDEPEDAEDLDDAMSDDPDEDGAGEWDQQAGANVRRDGYLQEDDFLVPEDEDLQFGDAGRAGQVIPRILGPLWQVEETARRRDHDAVVAQLFLPYRAVRLAPADHIPDDFGRFLAERQQQEHGDSQPVAAVAASAHVLAAASSQLEQPQQPQQQRSASRRTGGAEDTEDPPSIADGGPSPAKRLRVIQPTLLMK